MYTKVVKKTCIFDLIVVSYNSRQEKDDETK